MSRTLIAMALAAAMATLTGCNTYQIMQTNHFANDDGAIVRVDYGRAKRDHVNTFVSPANGKEIEFKSKLVVDVEMPEWPKGVKHSGKEPPFDGESFTAWQCMNFVNNGTMYRSDNDRFIFLANGFTCAVYIKDENDPQKRYLEVFRGVLCNTPVKPAEKDTRWHKIRPDQGTKKR